MNPEELISIFDRQAEGYDRQAERRAPLEAALRFLLEQAFADLPADARVLSVGAGTGQEVIHLAKRFPAWRFTVVEPSSGMIDQCRRNAETEGVAERCDFHRGFLQTLPAGPDHDAATCFLVSQFIVDKADRADFFGQIANRLKPGGILASSDLCFNRESLNYDAMLALWQRITTANAAGAEDIDRMKAAYARDVGVLPMTELAAIVEAGGFQTPLPFFQAGLVQAWLAKRESAPMS